MRRALPLLLPVALAACAVGPDYRKPAAPVPSAYAEAKGWKPAQPGVAASGTRWWSVYRDPVLDGLEAKVAVSNQTLKASEAAYRAAAATVEEARASFFPTASLDASGTRSKSGTSTVRGVQNEFSGAVSASWVPDIWGKIRRQVESDVATAQASAADLAAATLSAQATLASDYFELRVADADIALLDDTIKAYERSLRITRNQYAAGVAAKSDVITAETQLQSAQSSRIALGVTRAQLEHAIAVLIGVPPEGFSIAPAQLPATAPVVPAGLPSELLERRPDIAGAERRMAAANADVGVAIGAFFPDLTLSGSYGFAGSPLSDLFRAANSEWSLGASLAETIFDAGARSAAVDVARATWDESVANYRQTVLTAFQAVEDELAALRILERQEAVQRATVVSAEEAVRLTLNEYEAGTVAYTSVVTAQTTALSARQTLLSIRQSRLVASVTLIEALGGGWSAADLPMADATTRS